MKPKVIVDLGFDMGLSTIAFAHQNRGHTFGVDWIGKNNYVQKRSTLEKAFHNISLAMRLKFVKNIHLIVGPITEIAENWDREIDLIHFDFTHSYDEIKEQYRHWKRALKKDGVILVHDIESQPLETGRFFRELPLRKLAFKHNSGLGIATNNLLLYRAIKESWLVDGLD